MAAKTFIAKDVTGLSVYQTKNQTIYWDRFSKTAYIINNSNVDKFTNYQLRLPVSLLIGLGIMLISANFLLSLLATVVIFGIFEFNFRTKFLPNLAINSKWQKPKSKGLIATLVRAYSIQSLKTMTFMSIGFILLLMVNIFLSKESGVALKLDLVFMAILIVVALVFGISSKRKAKEIKD